MLRFAVLTLSDKGSVGLRTDLSGPRIAQMLADIGTVSHYEILPDEKELIKAKLLELVDKVDVIFTTGGTGLSARDVTPDATLEVIDKELPGIAEAMRMYGLQKTKYAMLSRAVAGIKSQTIIINLPGSAKAVQEGIEAIKDVIPHAVSKLKGDTSDCAR